MKHFALAAVLAVSTLLLGCSDTQLTSFQHSIGNFSQGVASVDNALADVSATLYKNCTTLQTIGQSAVDMGGSCGKAGTVLVGVNAVIQGYCRASQVTNIASAVSVTATTVNSTRAQLSDAKRSCGL